MTTAVRTLLEHLPFLLLEVQPVWGWYLALSWNAQPEAGRSPGLLAPWLRLAALAGAAPDPARLSEALDDAAAASAFELARASLLFHAGFLLPPAWATALDDVQGPDVPRFGVTPRFVNLVRADPGRAERRVALAQRAGLASRIAADFVYAALVACHDANVPVPPGIVRDRLRLEGSARSQVDESARYTGRLRLAARADAEEAARLAEEALREVGTEAIYEGLWSVMARCAEPRTLAQRLVATRPRTPTREVVLSLRVRCGAAQRDEVEASALELAAHLVHGSVDGRRAWPAAWRLLGAGVAAGAPAAIDSVLSLRPPAWAVELATWRELRAAPPALQDRLCAFQAGAAEAHHREGPLEPPSPPPWAWLPPEVFAARLRLLGNRGVPIPAEFAWGAGPP